MKTFIAILLYRLGCKPKCTMFIDENTIMYGYGKCHSIGVFEYNLPKGISDKLNKKYDLN
jgi:hypothetical protein